MSSNHRRPTWPLRALNRTLALALAAALVLGGCVGSGGLPIGGAPVTATTQPAGSGNPAASGSPAGSGSASSCPTRQPPSLATGQTRTVTITTPKGKIVIRIDGGLAPIATGNFVALATCGYYDGVVFQRLVPGFVIQGGDGQFGRVGADGKLSASQAALVGSGNPGYTIADDPPRTDYARGTVAMARTTDAHSEAAQFFIVLDNAAAQSLAQSNPYGYAILGNVTTGMDVVDAIAAMPNSGDPNNEAVDPVPMTNVSVGP
jgi:cyclophilin family peptidyl-prolyl cis-trans isomerase